MITKPIRHGLASQRKIANLTRMTMMATLAATVAEDGGRERLNRRIAEELAERGWSVIDDYLPALLCSQLAAESKSLWRDGEFRHAGVGRGDALLIRPEVRNDRVLWLERDSCSAAQRLYLSRLEALRLAINQSLFLGLFDFECHLAVYPPGSYYQKHLDQFQGVGLRTVTCILYLNHDWQPRDGGQLRIYTDPAAPDYYDEVLPISGRLVTFMSARFLHEVMPAHRDRMSITGWFKRRG
jgi:SM-20-related protein